MLFRSVNGTVAGVVRNRRDLQGNFTAELAASTDAAALVDLVLSKLTYGYTTGNTTTALRTEIVTAVGTIAIPALNANLGNQTSVDTAKRARVNAAVLLVLASPEFQIQQ